MILVEPAIFGGPSLCGAGELSSIDLVDWEGVPALDFICLPLCRRLSEPSTLRRLVEIDDSQKRNLCFKTKGAGTFLSKSR